MKLKFWLLSFMLILISGSLMAAPSPSSTYEIKVKVDGLTCPFCAYGLEKKLKRYPDVSKVTIFVDDGYALLQYPTGKLANFVALKELVRKGGFTAKDIHVRVSGEVMSHKKQTWVLMATGSTKQEKWQDHAFLLKGPIENLKAGSRIEVEGHVSVPNKTKTQQYPITINVKSWQEK